MSKRKVTSYKVPSSLKQRQRILALMKLLDLEAASTQFEKIIDRVDKKNGTFYDKLEALFDYEADYKENSRVDRLGRLAKFPLKKTFDDFNFSIPEKIDITLINELRSYRFIEDNKNVLIVGPLGVGKTHLACALGYEAIQNGYNTRCMTLEQIFEEANKTIDSSIRRHQKIMNLVNTRLLILDEIEAIQATSISSNATDFLYTIVRKRYESDNASTIFTFNESFKGWDKIFGSQERANKIIDRILERKYIVRIEGESQRSKGIQDVTPIQNRKKLTPR